MKVAGRTGPPDCTFRTLDPEAFARLSRTARAVLSELYRLANGTPYEGGYAELVQAVGRPLRTVERSLAALASAGMVRVRRADRTAPAQVIVHPGVGPLLGVSARPPHRIRDRRPPPAGTLAPDSPALRCAAVGTPGRTRFLPVSYVVDLLSERERAIVAYAASVNGGPVCADHALSADLLAYFRRTAQRERFRTAELARAALLREVRMRDDVEHFIVEDAA